MGDVDLKKKSKVGLNKYLNFRWNLSATNNRRPNIQLRTPDIACETNKEYGVPLLSLDMGF